MKTVVITGSSRGLGFEMAKVFRKSGLNVMLSATNQEVLEKAKKELEKIESSAKVEVCKCNVTSAEDMYICIVYIMFGGTRRLEIRQNKNYGDNPEYKTYVKQTPILLPFIPYIV